MSASQRVSGQRKALTLLEEFWGFVNQLHRDELEPTPLESSDDFADEAALDTIGLKDVEYMRVNFDHQLSIAISIP